MLRSERLKIDYAFEANFLEVLHEDYAKKLNTCLRSIFLEVPHAAYARKILGGQQL